MGSIGTLRVVLLWHMHQPYYRDMVSGEYRLPWVRMHALKDYYGMVKLLDEFPGVHQNFNLVPSLVTQIQDYASGKATDPFYAVAAKPAEDLNEYERQFALQYLFQANVVNLIGRYPRYKDLWERFHHANRDPVRAMPLFSTQDFADLQVLSQLAWFDEYFLARKDVQEFVHKGENFTHADQMALLDVQREIIAAVLPAYKVAAMKGCVELSATPYYHPILPLICDTDTGGISVPGLPLPKTRFVYPEDAEDQIRRALVSHENNFGVRPKGMWPSEGSVSEEVLAIAARNGVKWMATDEGVLGRSIGHRFDRTPEGKLTSISPEKLYNIWRFEKDETRMHMVFRDHHLSDLIGFVYSRMGAPEAAEHLMRSIKSSAEPVLKSGRDAVVSIILDGENAWEFYHENGRDFLRRFYHMLQNTPGVEAVTISEAIERHTPEKFGVLKSLTPGSWINANFNVWIGAPEDNKSWDYLAAARKFYADHADQASESRRELAYEELLIAQGSDWNWWYGPEHHSANDREFDDLYRKHLSNIYHALGAQPPEYLAQPISAGDVRPTFIPQTAYVHPRIEGMNNRYFDWMGAAMYTADRRTSAMHGKQFLLESIHAGVDEENLYARLDFMSGIPEGDVELLMNIAVSGGRHSAHPFRLRIGIHDGRVASWKLTSSDEDSPLASETNPDGIAIALEHIFEVAVPLQQLRARTGGSVKIRFSLWQEHLPLDALPLEGWVDLQVVDEDALESNVYNTGLQR